MLIAAAPRLASQPQPALTVSRDRMFVDGRATFLTGVSLFDALGPVPPRDQDLDALAAWKINAVRVWAHWHAAIYQADGSLTADGRTRLVTLARRLQSRGLVLEVVVLRPGELPRQPFALFASESARARGVDAVTEALRPFRNVLFDLYNEHDHPDGPISHADARALRDRVKAIDPARVVTISSTEYHVLSKGSAVDEAALTGEVGTGGGSVAVDVFAPHFPRTDDWDSATGNRIRLVRGALDRIGSQVPIYLNEERRATPQASVDPAAYGRARAAAQSAGAAGWIFHTSAGFDLRARAFLEALTGQERTGLGALARP